MDSGHRLQLGTPGPRFDDVGRIAVLRGGGLGDLLFAVPALYALQAAYPEAEITLLGSAVAAALFAGRSSPVAEVMVLPPIPGVQAGAAAAPAELEELFGQLQQRRFDLAVQVHGGGRNSNPVLLRLEPRHSVGTRTRDAAQLERSIPYVLQQHEVLRALEVVGLAGADPVELEPRIELTRGEAEQVREPGLVVLHPGGTDPRRRWPPDRFGAVAAALDADGARVVVVGDRADASLAAEVVRAARAAGAREGVTSVAGRIDLAGLVGLLARSGGLVGNDSGPRHLAAAVGTPTASVYWFGNLINAGPLSRARHQVQVSWTTCCPVCGRDATQPGWTSERCEHNVSFVADVPTEAVLADVRDLLG